MDSKSNEKRNPLGWEERPAVSVALRNDAQIAQHVERAVKSKNFSRTTRSATPVHDLVPLVMKTLAEHGQAALEMPRRAATLHEAGHVVMYAVEGERVKSVRIKSRRCNGKLAWGGQTFGGSTWRADPHTDPASDLRRARLVLAGVCAEMTFDSQDFRQGSSLDELVLGQRLCHLAACKLLRNPQELMTSTILDVRETLLVHEDVLLALASALDRHEWLRGERLAKLIEPLAGAAR